MLRITRIIATTLVTALVATVALAQSTVDLTGKWALEVTTDVGGTTTPNVTLKQDGEKLSGHYSSATLGEADVTGTIKGNAFTFSINADAGGQAVAVVYKGTVEKDTMKGTISLAGLGEGTFTGKRQ